MKSQKKKKTPLLQFIFLSALLHLGFFAAIIAPSIKTADYGANGARAVMVSLYPSGGGGGWGSEGGWGGGKGRHPAGNGMSAGSGANALLGFGTGSVRPKNTLTAHDPIYTPRPLPREESTPASLSKEDDGISLETAVKEDYAQGDEISGNAISMGFIPGKENDKGEGSGITGGHNNYWEGGWGDWGGGGDGGDGWGGGGSGKNIRNYITLISDSIKRNIYYPVSARRSGIEGKVLTSFLIETDGKAKDVRIKVSSGSTILDRCALKIIEKSLPFPAPPLKGLRVEVPLVFSLKDPPKAALPKNL